MTGSAQDYSELRGELVAYLDGELDEAATLQMEQTLGDDPSLRREAELLSRTFELLDELPRERASDDFTQRTVSTIRVSQSSPRPADRLWLRRAGRIALAGGWLVAMAVSAAIGYFAAQRSSSPDSQRLLEDFPVIRNVHVYQDVGSIEYLRALQEGRFFDEDPQSTEP